MPEEPLQKSLDRYDVLDRIAVGGMAEVFLAKAYGAHGFEKTLAIKRILPELASDPEFAARFIAEAKVAVRLSHANVVQVFDFGRIGESLFIAMEYVDGCDLAALIRKFKDEKRQLPLPAAFHIAIEIIRALDFAHGHNVVHRDVSPSNILISRAGEVKLGDFGIAVAAAPHATSRPGPKRVMGKWRYMSPEQARGDTLDTRSDLFSAASVLFELFTTEKLFPGDEAEDIVKNIMDMPIPRMATLRPGLPSRLDDVLASALARKPIDRPSRPATVLRSLIELSYESSIMATALDVAEAVAGVIPPRAPPGRGALDDVIRKQMADQSVARRTAVTGKPPTMTEAGREKGEVSTGLFRKIDIDGLSRLEESGVGDDPMDPPTATNTRVAPKRAPTPLPVSVAMPQVRDPDRNTEVGDTPPPATVPVTKVEAEALVADTAAAAGVEPPPAERDVPADEKSVTKTDRGGGSRRGLVVGLGLAVVAAGGVGIYVATRGAAPPAGANDANVGVVVAVDAPPGTPHGKVSLETTPPDAHGTLDGQPFASTPATLDVPVGKPLELVVERAGFRTLHETIEARYIAANQLLLHQVTLVPAPATVKVTTVPSGAHVTLDGKPLGDTPLAPVEVAAKKAELMIMKDDYEPVRLRVDLVAGKPFELARDLKPSQRFGFVAVEVSGARYVTVFLGKQRLGQSATMQGVVPLRVPVGKHDLELVKPDGKRKHVTVTITDKQTSVVKISID